MNTREPIDARRVSIVPASLPSAARSAAVAVASFLRELKAAESEVSARHSRGLSPRNARRLAHRKAGTGPDPKRFDRPPAAEARKARKALRRQLARAR